MTSALSSSTILGAPLPNIPWEGRPAGSNAVIWRYSGNPVIPRDLLPRSNSIFNSAVVPFEGGFAGVFRADDTRRIMNIHSGKSADGLHWDIEPDPIEFVCDDPEIGAFAYRYDPRVCWLEDRYYVTWCNGYHGPTIGVGYTYDFKTFTQIENAFLPYNRNGVLFPRKINGKYAMLSRPSDTGHTPLRQQRGEHAGAGADVEGERAGRRQGRRGHQVDILAAHRGKHAVMRMNARAERRHRDALLAPLVGADQAQQLAQRGDKGSGGRAVGRGACLAHVGCPA